jgi:hypothetical protein
MTMTSNHRWRPSGGFMLLCLTYAGLVGLLAWGFATPDLDRVWTLYHELRIGRRPPLSHNDWQLLRRTVEEQPDLARALIDDRRVGLLSAHRGGWLIGSRAVLLRRPGASPSIDLDVQLRPAELPVTAEIEGRGWKREQELTRKGRFTVVLPSTPERPELIRLRLRGATLAQSREVAAVRLILEDDRPLSR